MLVITLPPPHSRAWCSPVAGELGPTWESRSPLLSERNLTPPRNCSLRIVGFIEPREEDEGNSPVPDLGVVFLFSYIESSVLSL